jgi:hypothetical protein
VPSLQLLAREHELDALRTDLNSLSTTLESTSAHEREDIRRDQVSNRGVDAYVLQSPHVYACSICDCQLLPQDWPYNVELFNILLWYAVVFRHVWLVRQFGWRPCRGPCSLTRRTSRHRWGGRGWTSKV